jgi:hypothetical protein
MKRISLLSLIAVVTFAVGIDLPSIWISKHRPTVPQAASSNDCAPVYDATIVGKRIHEDDDPQLFAAFEEPPLYAMPDCVDEAYSLTWIPSFHPPVLVRLWRSGNRSFMVAKELDTKGWSEFGDHQRIQFSCIDSIRMAGLYGIAKPGIVLGSLLDGQ